MKLTTEAKQVSEYLAKIGFLQEGEEVTKVSIPGAGNMNFTIRVNTNIRSFIVKQSRDYVEKYPQVAAPADRCQREAEFYTLLKSSNKLRSMVPRVFHVDKEENIMIMADLGAGTDFTYLYKKDQEIDEKDLSKVMQFVATLHKEYTSDTSEYVIRNHDMRKLNHKHIFVYPFIDDNGLNLDDIHEGLEAIAKPYRADELLKTEVEKIGKLYLADGNTLLHGDYFPGSWLKTKHGIQIIDPEFCFFGFPEFEVGVTIAHLMLANQSEEILDHALASYMSRSSLDIELTEKCAGIEIMRRILGLAQLPLSLDLEQKRELLQLAYAYITD